MIYTLQPNINNTCSFRCVEMEGRCSGLTPQFCGLYLHKDSILDLRFNNRHLYCPSKVSSKKCSTIIQKSVEEEAGDIKMYICLVATSPD
ncbi:hypothetical protein EYR41_002970 [Orbilia oligospora]|uniref:Uncharacterized protein n=1 Tax=Orbilia oligospora TaxID=2813651 RepID=A0A7C8PR65_ORBOL|nr:hypothetical protein TWF751_004863 [Orbilia oligospora]TGJ70962.1 hypothetical protein EYR41_002970 [Orbilia oligospora]